MFLLAVHICPYLLYLANGFAIDFLLIKIFQISSYFLPQEGLNLQICQNISAIHDTFIAYLEL